MPCEDETRRPERPGARSRCCSSRPGLDPRSIDARQMSAVLRKVLPKELAVRAVGAVEGHAPVGPAAFWSRVASDLASRGTISGENGMALSRSPQRLDSRVVRTALSFHETFTFGSSRRVETSSRFFARSPPNEQSQKESRRTDACGECWEAAKGTPATRVGACVTREFSLGAAAMAASVEPLIGSRAGTGSGRIVAPVDRRGTILKYKADRGPVAFVVAVFVLRLVVLAIATPLFCVFSAVPLAVLGMFIAPINHHHQHVNTFRAPWLNRLYDLVLAVQSGVGPYNWVLHHNLGHHQNYLNQPPHARPDESRWTRADGTQMGRLEYTIRLLTFHQIDIVRIGLRHPRTFRHLLWMKLPLWGALGALLWFRPLETLFVFLLPSFVALCHTVWATYEHHAGCPGSDHLDASRNRDNRIYNALTGNLGLHTAHHKRPGLHWSLLPELHERIRHEIPEEQILKSFW